jgi:hypothetical protein
MKKSYIAPQTEAIQMLGECAIMAGSSKFIQVNADPVGGAYGD